ncbi:MAG: ATP-dependent Clp protease adaptor ClpS [Desulfobacterales bacterium]|nr:ATP-dependent Clp protease adaptor ClpS [Desulfobacterales bacterium]
MLRPKCPARPGVPSAPAGASRYPGDDGGRAEGAAARIRPGDRERQPGDRERERGVATKRPKVERPPRFKVVLYNDDYTPMEFVVHAARDASSRKGPVGGHRRSCCSIHRKRDGHRPASTCSRWPRPRSRRCHRMAEERGYPAARGSRAGMSRLISRELQLTLQAAVREAVRAPPRLSDRRAPAATRSATTSAARRCCAHCGA